ncbi:MAG: hypothetical protein QG556_586 [Pseudomonadota bacterium]|nr:hypothetical protein [Pseudomonadota bacterium]
MRSKVNPLHSYVVKLLNQEKYAWFATIPLACFDFTAWLSLTLLMLMILRKGIKPVWNLMCANFMVHGLSLYWFNPNFGSWVNAFLDFWPGYLAAATLLYTRSWSIVAWSMVAMSLICALGINLQFPDYAISELNHMLMSAKSLNLPLPIHVLAQMIKKHQDLSLHLMLGLQMMSTALNVIISLTMARSIQSQIFNPMGFLQEMLNLRGNRGLFLSLLGAILSILVFKGFLALYMIPTLLLYFFLVGMSIGVSVLAKNRIQMVLIVLSIAAMVLPYVFIPALVMIGALDSFVNFRALLAKRLEPTT